MQSIRANLTVAAERIMFRGLSAGISEVVEGFDLRITPAGDIVT
jgi:hypothetical protein